MRDNASRDMDNIMMYCTNFERRCSPLAFTHLNCKSRKLGRAEGIVYPADMQPESSR